MSERFTEDGRRRITESAVTSGQGGVPLVRIIENDAVASVTNDVHWNAAISSETPSPAVDAHSTPDWAKALTPLPFSPPESLAVYIVVNGANYWLNTLPYAIERLALDAHVEACWTVVLTPYFSSSAETLDAHITAYDCWQANRLLEVIERQLSERNDAWANDLAARRGVEPNVIRPMLRTLQNDFYRLNLPKNDWWNKTQRAEAEAEILEAFEEKLEDLSPAVKWSQQSRKRRPVIEARRVEVAALIRAEVDPATAAVRSEYPNAPVQQDRVNYKIADNLERRGENGGKRIGKRRIEQARKGR